MRMPNKNTRLIGAIAVCTAAILWGLDGTILTPNLYNLDVAFVVFLLHLIPFLIMNTFLFKEYKHLVKMPGKDLLFFLLVAVFGGALGTLAIIKALFLVNFDHLSIVLLLNKLQPVFAIILAFFLLKEKIRKGFIMWAGIAIIASYFMTFGIALPNFGLGENLLQASLFSLLAAFSFGAATVFGKKVVKKYDFKTASFYRFFFTTIIMAIYVSFFSRFEFNSITQYNWLMIGIISVLIGVGSMFIYYFGLTRIKASRSTIYELCFPISVVIFDYIFNNHLLSPVQLMAAAVMIFSIVRISLLKNK